MYSVLHNVLVLQDSYILANHWAAHMEKELFPQGGRFAPETLIGEDGSLLKNPRIMFFGVGKSTSTTPELNNPVYQPDSTDSDLTRNLLL